MALPIHWRAPDLTRRNPVSDQYDDTSGSFGHWRWLAGSVVLVPVMLAAGVYWLHHVPTGPSARQGYSTIQVELLPSPTPSPEVKQASLYASPPIADFQVTPTISEQVLPPVEQQAMPPQPLLPPRPTASPEQKPAGGGQARPVPAGTATRYQRQLEAHIERYQRYPNDARRDGSQETVMVMFAMRRDGSIVRVDIKSSSGRSVLDREAIETIRRAQPLPRIPADMPELLTVMIPVTFDAR
ncbi:energy transducer TonB family protein [Tardiphaga robiniae]|uniref:energy transducer TonB family protein n=1 Tax=Tardiphaga robiniae TaxID=943830 RepID=UPI0009D6800B|nr:energy transducer TonB [Tardiphaga robiniae]